MVNNQVSKGVKSSIQILYFISESDPGKAFHIFSFNLNKLFLVPK